MNNFLSFKRKRGIFSHFRKKEDMFSESCILIEAGSGEGRLSEELLPWN